MKQTCLISTLLFLFIHVTLCFSQELEFTQEVPESTGKFIHASNDRDLYYKVNHHAVSDLNILEYVIIHSKDSMRKQELVSQPRFTEGVLASFNRIFLQGEFIYETYNLRNKEGAVGLGIIKRELSSLKEVGNALELHDWEWSFNEMDSEGFYLLSSTNLYRINLNLEIVWKKEFEWFSDKNIRLNNIEVDNRLNLILSLSVKKNASIYFSDSIRVSKSDVFLIITDQLGGQRLIKPKVSESVFVKYARFNYNNEDGELIGMFLTSEEVKVPPPKKVFLGIGYAYFRWNDAGEIILAKNHAFSFNEFLDENLRKYASYYHFKPEKEGFTRTNYDVSSSHVEFLENGNVLYISHTLKGVVTPLEGSKLIYLLSPDGEVLWTKLIPLNDNELYWSGDYFIAENQLHFLIREFIASYENGGYVFKYFRSMVNGKTVVLAERVIDLENGQEVSNQPLIANPSEKFHPVEVIYNKDHKVVVKYSFPGKNLERLLVIKHQ
jgi:hypothetical protein